MLKKQIDLALMLVDVSNQERKQNDCAIERKSKILKLKLFKNVKKCMCSCDVSVFVEKRRKRKAKQRSKLF